MSVSRKRQPVEAEPFDYTEAAREIQLCHPSNGTDGFVRYLTKHTRIKDKETGMAVPFLLWPAQEPLADFLVQCLWIFYLKARQLGITWLIGAYMRWRCYYHRFWTGVCINQKLPYAVEYIDDKVKFMHNNGPAYFRIPLLEETKTSLKFGRHEGMPYSLDSSVFAVAGNEDAARSWTANFALFDEAARIREFKQCMQAAEPGLKNAKGNAAVVSSSRGPKGPFYTMWRNLEKKGEVDKDIIDVDGAVALRTTRWIGVFLPWNANPNRTQKWYDEETEEHEHDPDYMRREFPRTPAEAFMAAGGRIHPKFFDRPFQTGAGHLLNIPPDQIDETWERYRGIDWGESVSAFVCLWAVVIPSNRPCLTVDPACNNLIDEMLAYSYKEDSDEPEDKYDHGPDALRYIVATFGLEEWVHIYREWYVFDPVSKGYSTQSLAAGIRRRSGWTFDEIKNEDDERESVIWTPENQRPEEYVSTVCDRARPMLVNDLQDYGIDAEGHTDPETQEGITLDKREARREGRIMVNRLIVGALPRKSGNAEQPDDERQRIVNAVDLFKKSGVRTAASLERTIRKVREKRDRRNQLRRLQRFRRIRRPNR